LDYTVGLADDWLQAVRSSGDCSYSKTAATPEGEWNGIDGSECHILTPCHTRLMHGTYDQGSKPSVALSRFSAVGDDGTGAVAAGAFFLELHEGFPSDALYRKGGCGEPIRRDGVVLDSFDISDWVQALSR
jgi:hypothetical protein